MPTIAQDTNRVSDWLKHEYEPSSGYCREEKALADIGGAYATGSVLDADGDIVTAATVADAAAILLTDLKSAAYAEDHLLKAVVLVRGPVIVNVDQLVLADEMTPAAATALTTKLKTLGIMAEAGF